MRVFITGDSHAGAIKRGLATLRGAHGACQDVDVEVVALGNGMHMTAPFFEDLGTRARIVEASYKTRIKELPLPGAVGRQTVYCWCGLFHFAKLWRNGSWIRCRPAFMAGPGIPVSTGLMTAVIRDWFGQQLALIEVLKRSGVKVIAVESPRPFRHHPALRLIRADVVAGVDGFCQGVMLAELRQRKVEVVRIPSACVDSDGFMHSKWRHELPGDRHHGNAMFGALMVERICKQLQGQIDG